MSRHERIERRTDGPGDRLTLEQLDQTAQATARAAMTGGADPQTMAPLVGLAAFEPVVLGGIAGAATMHHCHTPEIELTSATTASGIWAMEDLLVFPDGSRLHGAGHYHEEYEKRYGRWQITRLHLTRTLMDFTAAPA